MKKILAVAASLIFVVVSANSQSEKKEPPPPPPKPKEEIKYKVVKEEKVKFTPPKIVKDEEVQVKEEPKVIVDEKVNVSKPKEPPVITVKGKFADDFYKRNLTVSDISSKGNITTLKMKDGTTEKYDMSKKEENKSFTEKYGVSPIPPPPPPPKQKTKA